MKHEGDCYDDLETNIESVILRINTPHKNKEEHRQEVERVAICLLIRADSEIHHDGDRGRENRYPERRIDTVPRALQNESEKIGS